MASDDRLSPGALFYYGAIEGQAAVNNSTAAIWSAIKATQESVGGNYPRVSAAQVSIMRGMAGANLAAAARFENSPDQSAILGEHIGTAPWARDPNERNAMPMWQAQFNHLTTGPEGDKQSFRVVTFRGTFPQTKDDFLATLDQDAEAIAADYGEDHVSISNISILSI